MLKCEYLLEKFGGHKYAAGLTIKKQNLNSFIKEFEKVVANTITKDQLVAEIEVDMEIELEEVNDKLYRIIKQFAPFGPMNRTPNFITKSVTDSGKGRKVGEDKSHLRLTLNTLNKDLISIGFSMGDDFEKITDNKPFDICYSIDENTWNGTTSLQLRLKGVK